MKAAISLIMSPLVLVGVVARIVFFALSVGWEAGIDFLGLFFGKDSK